LSWQARPLAGGLTAFALPLALTGILQQMFNAADVAVVGQCVGEDAMAAVGSSGPIIGLIINLFLGISMGANVVIATNTGADEALEGGAEVLSLSDATESGSTSFVYEDPVAWNTEEYSAREEFGFVSPVTSPLSTVSADVDTASYCNLRRMLRDGWAAQDMTPVPSPASPTATSTWPPAS